LLKSMKIANLIVVVSLLFCYSGINHKLHHFPFFLRNINNDHTAHHNIHEQEFIKTGRIGNFNQIIGKITQEMPECCGYSLLTASGNNVNQGFAFIHIIGFNEPTLDIKSIANNTFLSIEKNRKYRPPDIVISNSSLLL
jgi:hypothetical protein